MIRDFFFERASKTEKYCITKREIVAEITSPRADDGDNDGLRATESCSRTEGEGERKSAHVQREPRGIITRH